MHVRRRWGPVAVDLIVAQGRLHRAWGEVGLWLTPLPDGAQVELAAFVGDAGAGLAVTARAPRLGAVWRRLRRSPGLARWSLGHADVSLLWLAQVGVGARWHRWLYYDLCLGPVAVHGDGPLLRLGDG